MTLFDFKDAEDRFPNEDQHSFDASPIERAWERERTEKDKADIIERKKSDKKFARSIHAMRGSENTYEHITRAIGTDFFELRGDFAILGIHSPILKSSLDKYQMLARLSPNEVHHTIIFNLLNSLVYSPVINASVSAQIAETQQAREEEIQLSIPTSFAPTKSLVDYWKNGIKYYLEIGNSDIDASVLTMEQSVSFDSYIRTKFSDALWARLIRFARFQREKGTHSAPVILPNKTFSAKVENVVSEIFPIRPTELSNFIEQLGLELYNYFSTGGIKKGNWGELKFHNDHVIMILNQDSYSEKLPATNSKEIEIEF